MLPVLQQNMQRQKMSIDRQLELFLLVNVEAFFGLKKKKNDLRSSKYFKVKFVVNDCFIYIHIMSGGLTYQGINKEKQVLHILSDGSRMLQVF